MWDEFLSLTMAQLEALEERRAIKVRHARFNAGLIASAIVNVNRSADSEPMSPFDFLAGFERDPEEEEKQKLRKSIKSSVAMAFANMGDKTSEYVQKAKAAMIDRMTAQGIEDPAGLVREVFPDI